MKKLYFTLIAFTAFLCTAAAQSKSNKIDNLFSALYKDGQFSGAVLVAKQNKIIYQKSFGFANRTAKEPFTTDTPCYIGSLTKQFVGMGIMMLQEKGKLDYNHPIRKYFPELPECMEPVKISHLLHHTSGLALFGDYPDMNEQNVIDILLQQKSLRFAPGEKFEYCNAGYTLLGVLIEEISGQNLNDFLTEQVFRPLGMNNSYINSPSLRNRKRAVGYYVFGDTYDYDTFIGGAGSMISTVNDLYKWDKALYEQTLVSKVTLAKVFQAGSPEISNDVYGSQTYGFGWFLSGKASNPIMQHDGGFGGFRAYIERQPKKANTIIYISNVRHSLKDDIRTAINQILEDKTYTIPKSSWANKLMEQTNSIGMEKAIAGYWQLKTNKIATRYYFSETEFNSLGYYLMRNNRLTDAILFFTLNTEENPNSANAFDSLAEAYMNAGDKEQAIKNYKKSLELDKNNWNARQMIEKLSKP